MSFTGELIGGRNWVEDFKAVKTRPVVNESEYTNESFNALKRGSTFKIKFDGDNIRPKDLSWYSAKTPQQWLYLLLIKTPLGSIDYISSNGKSITFNLKVIKKDGTYDLLENQNAKYIYPNSKIKASINIKDILKFQQKAISLGKDPSNIPNKYKKSNGIYEFYSRDEVLDLRKNDEEIINIVKEYNIEAYGYFTYSTSVWDSLNDTSAKLRKGYRVLRGGLQLANNKMIQGELIPIPLTSNIGHQNQCHVIVHFKNADSDLGRKGFQHELKDVAVKLSVSIVNRLKNWKHLLKSDSGAKPDIEKEINLHEWIRAQEKHELSNPLVLKNKNFFVPINEISITSEPQSEQHVIVLFNQLIAGGVIRGIKLLATSQVKQYDGVYKYVVRNPLSNHEFDKSDNPLGVGEMRFSSELTSPPKVLEYKFNLDALIREFESGDKNEKDIHLVVTWELGNEWRKNYEAISYLDLSNLHHRDFHGLTHQLDSGTTKFQVIVLKELIDYLNDVDGIQEYYHEKYGEDIFE